MKSEEKRAYYSGTTFYIKPDYIVGVPVWEKPGGKGQRVRAASLKNLEQNTTEGVVSEKAAKKLRCAVSWLLVSAKWKRVFDKESRKTFRFKVNFITLTLPFIKSPPSDQFLKKNVFHALIVYARKYFGLRNYIWRAEAQENGMLHFHITSDTFIHWQRLRNAWNRILDRHGLLDDFANEYGHKDPNSTDIHSVHKVRNLGAYLSKYLTKSDDTRRKITGRLWGCNYELSAEYKCSTFCDPDQAREEGKFLFKSEVQWKEIKTPPDYMGRTLTIADLFLVSQEDWEKMPMRRIRQAYDARRFEIRNNVAQMPPEYYQLN